MQICRRCPARAVGAQPEHSPPCCTALPRPGHRSGSLCQATAGRSAAKQQQKAQNDDEVDYQTLVKYAGALALQTGLMTGALAGLQQASTILGDVAGEDAPRALVGLFFLIISLRSRIFSPLDATRPTLASEKNAIPERRRPSWMPPPATFPIVWSLVALLRTISSLIVWDTTDTTFCVPLVLLCLHLAVGDTWNHINNQEKRLGVAVPGVLACWGSCVLAVAAFYQCDHTAGLVLAPSAVWIGVASALIYSIWTLNDDYRGERAALLPLKGETRAISEAKASAGN